MISCIIKENVSLNSLKLLNTFQSTVHVYDPKNVFHEVHDIILVSKQSDILSLSYK